MKPRGRIDTLKVPPVRVQEQVVASEIEEFVPRKVMLDLHACGRRGLDGGHAGSWVFHVGKWINCR